MRKIVFAAGLLLASICSEAQKLSIENVHKVTLRNSDAIKEGSEVKGYYFFYVSDKIDKRTNEYTLQITDNNLVKLKDIKFQDSKHVTILESSFNGTDLIFLLYNGDTRMMEYQVYGADAKKKYTYNRELSKKEVTYLAAYMDLDDEDDAYKGLYPVESKGFISNMPSREDKDYTFQLDFFSSEKRKQWSYIPTQGAKKFNCDYLGCYNGIVYLSVSKGSSLMDNNPDVFITGLSLETGKLLFEKPADKSKYSFLPVSLSAIDGKVFVYGQYFNPNGNVMKDKSLGFAFWGIDDKGAVLSEKYCSWDLDLGKYLDVNSKGKISDFGYMYLHNMVQTGDGSIYAIGEGFSKKAAVLGMLSAASRGGGISTMRITDMILIKFDKDFKVKEAKIYDKNSNTALLPGGYAYMSTPLIGKVLKAYGKFDYSYTLTSKDNSSFTICYSDYVKSKEYKGGTFNSISYNEGKISTDKINTKTDATQSYVLPAKQGQVLILDYYKKTKRIDAHFEKLN